MKSPYFIKSAVRSPDYPQESTKEIALVGRSNAGKSSLLNTLLGQKLAHVSQSPGKTQLINFYHWQSQCTLVDLPGYGYAKRSKA
ncbi:MAG: 50S ribosome-binding GTPase, partial [Bdellovibrionaceae bacterium]|nr:50S ribosome-binding GTPase [Pseudobdellovibrionaceae bacterium]